MKPILLGEIRNLVNGKLIQGSDNLHITDAANYLALMNKPNMLAFLLEKWKINWDAIRKSVPCAVITDKVYEELKSIDGCTIILVNDIKSAYWMFVEYYRSLFDIPVVAVTGTSGKTTTKDMILHMLKNNCKACGTAYSANGRPGHFSYLLKIDETIEAAVFETAVGAPGDITVSSKYFKPLIGVITNIGVTHIDGCKTAEGYLMAKAEMVTSLSDEGILIVNADDENCKKIGLEKFKGRIVYYGIHNPSHIKATDVEYTEKGMKFVLTLNHMKYRVFVGGYGEHQVHNALAALGAVHELGLGIKEAAEKLDTFHNMREHLQLTQSLNGSVILDDTWNSNPTSLRAAIKTLNGIANGRKKIALIGNIKALGDIAAEVHRQVGDMIAEYGVDMLITVGSSSELIARQALEKGLKGEIHSFPNIDGVFGFVARILDENSIMMIKCSSSDLPIKDLVKSLCDKRQL